MLEKFIADLSSHLKLGPAAQPREKNTYEIAINQQTHVSITKLEIGYFLTSGIGQSPDKRLEEFYIYMMRANFLGQGTGRAVIGMEAGEKNLTLSLYIPYEVSYLEFKDKLESLVNYIEYWRKEIQKFKDTESLL